MLVSTQTMPVLLVSPLDVCTGHRASWLPEQGLLVDNTDCFHGTRNTLSRGSTEVSGENDHGLIRSVPLGTLHLLSYWHILSPLLGHLAPIETSQRF